MSLNDHIIKYSVGIGASLAEAQATLKIAKLRDKNSLENIAMVDGDFYVRKEQTTNSDSSNYQMIVDFLKDKCASKKLMIAADSLRRDAGTGLFNKVGYATAMMQLKEKGFKEGYFIFLDGNDMHDHNRLKGYEEVDEYLTATGKAILEATRNSLDRRSDERGGKGRREQESVADIICHRVNDSAGDEFLIYVPMNHSFGNRMKAYKIAERVLEKIYDSERKVAEKQNSELITNSTS